MNEFFIRPGKRLYELDLCQLLVAFCYDAESNTDIPDMSRYFLSSNGRFRE